MSSGVNLRLAAALGLLGLCLLVFVVTVWKIGPDWNTLWSDATSPHVPADETVFTYAYYAIALFGAAMTPYEVFASARP